MKPDLGQLVYYVPYDRVASPLLAAFVSRRLSDVSANLHVLSATGTDYAVASAAYDDRGGQGTWHYTTDVIPLVDQEP